MGARSTDRPHQRNDRIAPPRREGLNLGLVGSGTGRHVESLLANPPFTERPSWLTRPNKSPVAASVLVGKATSQPTWGAAHVCFEPASSSHSQPNGGNRRDKSLNTIAHLVDR